MPQRPTDPDRRPQGQTLPEQGQTQTHDRVPRAPHERDESADSQEAGEPTGRAIGKIAHDDLAKGRVDTDKGPVLDATYDRLGGGEENKKKLP